MMDSDQFYDIDETDGYYEFDESEGYYEFDEYYDYDDLVDDEPFEVFEENGEYLDFDDVDVRMQEIPFDFDPDMMGEQYGMPPQFMPPTNRPPFSGRPPQTGRPPQAGRPPQFGRPPFSGRPPFGQIGRFERCLNRMSFVTLNNGSSFWFFPTNVRRQRLSGFRWRRNRWEPYSIDTFRIIRINCN